MGYSIIPSGSLGAGELSTPSWAQPTAWWGVEAGSLARVLPLGGQEWSGELVLILEEILPTKDSKAMRYKVIGRKGATTLPYYALSVERYKKKEL